MGFFRKKDKENKQISTEAQEVTQEAEQSEEVQRKMDQGKKKYLYIAVNREGEVLLRENNSPYFGKAEEGSAPEWPPEIISKAMTDTNLRVELAEISSTLSKSDKEKARREVRNNAKNKLRDLAADKIQSAIAKKEGNGILSAEKQSSKKENEENDGTVGEVNQESMTKEDNDIETGSKEEIVGVETKENNQTDLETEKEESMADRSNNKLADEQPKRDETSLVDSALIVEIIKNTEENLNQDFNDFVDDIQESIRNMSNENAEDIKKHTESKIRILDGKMRQYAEDSVRLVADRTQKAAENVIGRINETSKTLNKGQEEIVSKVTSAVGKSIKDISASVEGIEGKLHRLDQIDNIVELLQNKGLVMSMDIPPVNADEEDIVNLVRYSQKITEQLGYAARELIRKQEVFRSQAQSNANEQSIIEQKIAVAHEEGVKEGQKRFIRHLVSKYADVDTIKDSDDGHVHAIWALLMESGAKIDANGNFEKGKEVTVSEEEAYRMMGTYAKIDGAGKYRVLKTGLVYSGEIIYKAEFEKIET